MSDTPTASSWTRDQLNARLVRYADLIPCTTAFVDTRTPGSEGKENFTIIGPGVSESPDQHVHIDIPHGFNIGGARQPPNCVNSQHSHETAEVFVVHSGRWAFYLGENAETAEVILEPGDVISVPIHVFRGFENVGDGVGFLFAVLGEDDPGRVTWAPYVFEAAKRNGLVLLEDGSLVDLTRGETVPEGAAVMPPTTAEDVARLKQMDTAALRRCVVRGTEFQPVEQSLLTAADVAEVPIIGTARSDGMDSAKLDWSHGFQLRKVVLQPGSETAVHARPQEEVVFTHRGALSLTVGGVDFELGPGDVMTIPVNLPRQFRNSATETCELYAVDGGDNPAGEPLAAT